MLVRFGVSIEEELLKRFDELIKDRNYPTRSKAIADLMRQEFVNEEWQKDKEVAGTITIIYDHHKRRLVNKILDIQHDFGSTIISAQHIHLDHHNCLEIIAVKGAAEKAQELSNTLKAVKGVKHGSLTMSTTGKNI